MDKSGNNIPNKVGYSEVGYRRPAGPGLDATFTPVGGNIQRKGKNNNDPKGYDDASSRALSRMPGMRSGSTSSKTPSPAGDS